MKSVIAQTLANAITALPDIDELARDLPMESTIERSRDASHGDFASNVAMRLAKTAGRNPRELANVIVAQLQVQTDNPFDEISVAGPGFINFRLRPTAFYEQVQAILEQGETFGRQAARASPHILLEFVSANPTGPLHVGHGRHAAYGATVGNLLEAAGYKVDREYYVNDAGRQMDILGVSVWLRWLATQSANIPFPTAGYRGDYILDIVAGLDIASVQTNTADEILEGLPEDAPVGDKETHIDALIHRAKSLLSTSGFNAIRQQALESILDDIRDDLSEFGVRFDNWFSEQSLTTSGRIDATLDLLDKRGLLYEQAGATWFRATNFGDEKDRVVVRENGNKTYFASDIAYHCDKRTRGYDHLINLLGSDHHGYVARLKGGLDAAGYSGDDLEVRLVQFVTLYRAGEKVQMSTRSGEFVTLRELRGEVGNDAARFFYVLRSNDQHLDFDLELAKSRSNDNPVYYIQYAHARIASVFRQLSERGLEWHRDAGLQQLKLLQETQETALMRDLTRYPEVVVLAADSRAPQHLVHYLRELANDFHSYYNAQVFIVDDDKLRNARLALIAATRTVLANGLRILGVSAPEAM